MTTALSSPERIERLARRRAGMRMGWLIHATVFVAVNLLLALISFSSGRNWAIYPFLGWGLGLTIHGAVVLAAMPGAGLMERMVEQERRRLMQQRDPW
jgi:hypothetical protein